MAGIITNAAQIASLYRRRMQKLDSALRAGMKKAAAAVNLAAGQRLSGAGAPGSYPVPRRTGALARGQSFSVQSTREAIVFNTASHAVAIHEGLGSSSKYGRRPFLDDAAAQVDATEIMVVEMRKALFAA